MYSWEIIVQFDIIDPWKQQLRLQLLLKHFNEICDHIWWDLSHVKQLKDPNKDPVFWLLVF